MNILVSLVIKIHANALVPDKYEIARNIEIFEFNGKIHTKERVFEILNEFNNLQVSNYDYINRDASVRIYPHSFPAKSVMTPSEKKYCFDEGMSIEEFMEYAYES